MLGGGGFCLPFLGGAAWGGGTGAGVEEKPGLVMGGCWRGDGVGKKV